VAAAAAGEAAANQKAQRSLVEEPVWSGAARAVLWKEAARAALSKAAARAVLLKAAARSRRRVEEEAAAEDPASRARGAAPQARSSLSKKRE
jgi:hypothetical protein